MANNEQWLFENTPRANYRAHGVRRAEGIRIAAGLARIQAQKQPRASQEVYFGNFFSPMSRPIVVASPVSNHARRIMTSVDGLGAALHPDNRGFQVHVIVDNGKKARKIERTFYVAWQAIGY